MDLEDVFRQAEPFPLTPSRLAPWGEENAAPFAAWREEGSEGGVPGPQKAVAYLPLSGVSSRQGAKLAKVKRILENDSLKGVMPLMPKFIFAILAALREPHGGSTRNG